MKTVDKKTVYSSQSAEFIQQAETGKFLKLVSDTFILKAEDGTQGYAIRHLNRKDMILIDTTGIGAKEAMKHLREEGYTIKGIIITHKEVVNNAYASLKTISDDAGGVPVITHSMNVHDPSMEITDITRKNNIFDHFAVRVRDFPAKNGEASVIYSEINEGMVFAGCCAFGAPYDSEKEGFERADMGSENKDFSLAESWRSYMEEFRYFFPYRGKPGFNLSEGQQTDIIQRLGSKGYPAGGNPNL